MDWAGLPSLDLGKLKNNKTKNQKNKQNNTTFNSFSKLSVKISNLWFESVLQTGQNKSKGCSQLVKQLFAVSNCEQPFDLF